MGDESRWISLSGGRCEDVDEEKSSRKASAVRARSSYRAAELRVIKALARNVRASVVVPSRAFLRRDFLGCASQNAEYLTSPARTSGDNDFFFPSPIFIDIQQLHRLTAPIQSIPTHSPHPNNPNNQIHQNDWRQVRRQGQRCQIQRAEVRFSFTGLRSPPSPQSIALDAFSRSKTTRL